MRERDEKENKFCTVETKSFYLPKSVKLGVRYFLFSLWNLTYYFSRKYLQFILNLSLRNIYSFDLRVNNFFCWKNFLSLSTKYDNEIIVKTNLFTQSTNLKNKSNSLFIIYVSTHRSIGQSCLFIRPKRWLNWKLANHHILMINTWKKSLNRILMINNEKIFLNLNFKIFSITQQAK